MEALREAARERQRGGQGGVLLVETLPQASEQKTRDQAATMFNTNGRYIDMATQLKENEPELFEEVRAGKLSLPKAKKKARAKEQQREKESSIKKRSHADIGDI